MEEQVEKPKRFKGQALFCQGIEGMAHTFGDWQRVFIPYPSYCHTMKGIETQERRCLVCNKNFFRTE